MKGLCLCMLYEVGQCSEQVEHVSNVFDIAANHFTSSLISFDMLQSQTNKQIPFDGNIQLTGNLLER